MIHTKYIWIWLALLSSLLLHPSSFLLAQSPDQINYQGRLMNGTNLVNGTVGLTLRLFNAPTAGTLTYADSNTVTVVDGLYSTFLGDNTITGALDFALLYTSVWLEAVVNGIVLTPRERLASVPYARVVHGWRVSTIGAMIGNPEFGNNAEFSSSNVVIAGGADNTIATQSRYSSVGGGLDNDIGSFDFPFIQGLDNASVIGGGAGNTVKFLGSYNVIAGGRSNFIGRAGNADVIGGGRDNNIASNTTASTISGGIGNQILSGSSNSVIGGGVDNIIQSASRFNVIDGGFENEILTNVMYGTIGGGEDNRIGSNTTYVVLAGGAFNEVDASQATLGGGAQNSIDTASIYATIGGGWRNNILSNGLYNTIAGGRQNMILANASNAMIPGGFSNVAAHLAFAAGNQARALHSGAFVWSDSSTGAFTSTATNQFLVRAGGGVGINTNNPQADLDVNGSIRVGNGTVLSSIRAGSATLGPGTNTQSYTVTFPSAFATAPKVIATPRNDPSFDVVDTFSSTIRKVTTTNFVINIQRVDAAAGWAQQLRLDWMAWE
jgi:hypothetical protein